MYTREDIGKNVYLPEWGLQPCTIHTYRKYDEKNAVVVVTPDTNTLFFTSSGKRCEGDQLPVLSRKPYVRGGKFECVTELPEPEYYTPQHNEPFIAKVNGTYTIATLKSSAPLDVEWYVKTIEGAKVSVPVEDVHPFSEAPQRIGMCASNYALFVALERMGVMPPEAYLDDVPFPTASRGHHSPADAESVKERPFGEEGNQVIMPASLTYENGAKGLFIGEFYETIEVSTSEDHEAETGECTVDAKVPVSWTTIKEIYALAVMNLGKPFNEADREEMSAAHAVLVKAGKIEK